MNNDKNKLNTSKNKLNKKKKKNWHFKPIPNAIVLPPVGDSWVGSPFTPLLFESDVFCFLFQEKIFKQ